MQYRPACQDRIQRICQVVRGRLPARFTEIGVKIVDAAAISNLSRSVDQYGFRCDRCLRPVRDLASFINCSRPTAVAEFDQVSAKSRGREWKVLINESARHAARLVRSTNALDLGRI